MQNISYILQCLEITGSTEALTFSWTKDGHRLLPSKNLKIEKSQASSILTFLKLQPQNSGSYECRVKNFQDEIDFTSTRLTVKGLLVVLPADGVVCQQNMALQSKEMFTK